MMATEEYGHKPPNHGTTNMLSAFWGISYGDSQPNELGQGLVEYALILMLLAIVVIGAVTIAGQGIEGMYDRIKCAFPGAAGDPDCS